MPAITLPNPVRPTFRADTGGDVIVNIGPSHPATHGTIQVIAALDGEKVLRVKGILNVAGSATPVAVHGAQHLVHPPVHMTAWPDGDRSSRLVLIVDGIDRSLIERSLRAFLQLAAPSPPAA